ncbi:MAG TPA: nucleotidyl transferase AbiEii/AbiGii toxin family protein [Jatrophihabitans sp.]|jgi:hypothetical protein|uniref:nucleotidyl transferase AbiEii/AbiGii toxin family protein n=1 Tax=Jatrophihabitans sp. TaxID=1932789 RepID=UPI002EDCDC35
MAADDLVPAGSDPLTRLTSLGERGKEPASKSILNAWVNQAQAQVGLDTGRLGWLVASTVVVAALQRAIDEEGRTRFLLKGGTYLQHRLSWSGRPTKDIDGMVRGDIDEFLAALDDALRLPWGPLVLTRDAIEVINTPGKIIKPRRFDVLVSLKGQVWRRIQIEIAADEAGAIWGARHPRRPGPAPLRPAQSGPPSRNRHAVPDRTEIHAGTDPHDPPDLRNDRARDIVDLLLLRDLVHAEQSPTAAEVRQACVSLFESRSAEARELGRPERRWPPVAIAHEHWSRDYSVAATAGGVTVSLADAVGELNRWIALIDAAG